MAKVAAMSSCGQMCILTPVPALLVVAGGGTLPLIYSTVEASSKEVTPPHRLSTAEDRSPESWTPDIASVVGRIGPRDCGTICSVFPLR